MTAALLAVAACPVHAAPPQTVYRCGPDGRVYSQTPCADGKAVNVDDARSASQHKAAGEVAAREAKQAQQLAQERKQREAAARGQSAIGIKTAPVDEAASAPARKSKAKKPADPGNMSPPMRAPLTPKPSN